MWMFTMDREEILDEKSIAESTGEKDKSIGDDRIRSEVIFSHPCRRKWYEREEKYEEIVDPKCFSIYLLDYLERVMVIVPVNREKYETQYIRHKDMSHLIEGSPLSIVRSLEFEYHDRDDDGYDGISIGKKSFFCHKYFE